MLYQIVKLYVREGQEDTFVEKFKAMQARVKDNEPDTILYELCRDSKSPTTFVVVECYKDQAAVETHMKNLDATALKGILAKAPDLEVFEAI